MCLGPSAISGPHSRSELNADVRNGVLVECGTSVSPPLTWIQAQVDETHVLVLYLSTTKVIKNIYLYSLYTSTHYSRIDLFIQVDNQLTPSLLRKSSRNQPHSAYNQARSSFHITTMSTQPLLQRTQKKVSHYSICEDQS